MSIDLVLEKNLHIKEGKCTIHNNSLIIFYCANCKELICEECFSASHQNHLISPLSFHMRNMQNAVQSQIKQLIKIMEENKAQQIRQNQNFVKIKAEIIDFQLLKINQIRKFIEEKINELQKITADFIANLLEKNSAEVLNYQLKYLEALNAYNNRVNLEKSLTNEADKTEFISQIIKGSSENISKILNSDNAKICENYFKSIQSEANELKSKWDLEKIFTKTNVNTFENKLKELPKSEEKKIINSQKSENFINMQDNSKSSENKALKIEANTSNEESKLEKQQQVKTPTIPNIPSLFKTFENPENNKSASPISKKIFDENKSSSNDDPKRSELVKKVPNKRKNRKK